MHILKQIQTTVTEQFTEGFQSTKKDAVQTQLYTCTECGTTYIAREMNCCPDCQADLDEVPSGSELGITAVEK